MGGNDLVASLLAAQRGHRLLSRPCRAGAREQCRFARPRRPRRAGPGRPRPRAEPGARGRAAARTRARRADPRHPRYARPAMTLIDLRSDTVTHPTDAMRRAMAAAEVGDDVFGDDPTVNALEARAAELLGKEAGLFVASGTMGNLVSLHGPPPARLRGDRRGEHPHASWTRPAATRSSSAPRSAPLQERPDGTMDPADDRRCVARPGRPPRAAHRPRRSLENTHAHSGGRPLPLDYVRTVGRHRPRARRPAPHRRRAVLQRRRSPSASRPPSSPRRPTR